MSGWKQRGQVHLIPIFREKVSETISFREMESCMGNQSAAENAMQYARKKTGAHKTANKFFNEMNAPASFKRRYEASLYRGSIEKEAPKLGATVDDIVRYAQRAMEVQAGNCGEQAAIAYA